MPDCQKVHTTFCDACKKESFVVAITESGQGQNDFGTCYWWAGDGKCTNCGHADWYSDSSP